MNEILNDKMLHEIFEAFQRGESYGYSDGNTSVEVTPNSIRIQYNSTKSPDCHSVKSNKDKEVKDFLNFCDKLDDDLFAEACESFSEDELNYLQNNLDTDNLDTDNYRHTITTFTTRVREIAGSKLAEIVNDADAEIRHQENIIKSAKAVIEDIHNTLDNAYKKYSI